MIWILLSYIIGVIGWELITSCDKFDVYTYGDLMEELEDSPVFIPVINIVLVLLYIICITLVSIMIIIYKYSGFEKLWNKIKYKKIKS